MPLLVIALLFALMMMFVPPLPSPFVHVAENPRPMVEYHYTRGGIVEINRTTGATRFKPYRVAEKLDRRRAYQTV